MWNKSPKTMVAGLVLGLLMCGAAKSHATDYQYNPDQNNTGTSPRDWADPAQWTPNGVPGADDTATINVAADRPAINTYAPVSVRGLTVVSGTASSSDGGSITVQSSSSGAGTFTWTGGTVGGILNLTPDASANFGSGADMTLSGTINNAGNINFAGAGRLLGAAGSLINNSGTFTLGVGSHFNYSAGTDGGIFNNTGTLVKTGGDTSTLGDFWVLHTTGLVNIQSGVLQLQNDSNNINAFQSPARFTGPGRTVVITDLQLIGNVSIDAGSTVELGTGGTMEGPSATSAGTELGGFIGAGTFNWTGGAITPGYYSNDVITLAPGLNFLISGGDLKDGGSSVINDNANTVWTGSGQIQLSNANFTNAGTFNAQNDSTFTFNEAGDFINTGTFTKSNSTGATTFDHINLTNSGVVNAQTGTIVIGSGYHVFKNGGHFTGAGRTKINGTLHSNNAEVVLQNTSTIAAGATLELANQSALHGAGTLGGPGTFNWTGGAITGNEGDSTSNPINIAAGTNFLISGPNQKVMDGDVTVNNSGNGVWTGTGDIQNSATFNNLGTLVAQSDALLDYNTSGTFNNKGTFTKQGTSGSTRIENTFLNTGTVNINSGTLFFDHDNYDPYSQSGATSSTNLNHGNLTLTEGQSREIQELDINGGKLTGIGTITANVVNKGMLSVGLSPVPGTHPAPTPGILTIVGGYNQFATASLNLDISGRTVGTQYDQLRVTGAAMLSGTLNVTTVAPYVPANLTTYAPLSYRSHTGAFAHVNGLVLGTQRYYAAAYNPTAYVLTYHVIPLITAFTPTAGIVATSVRITGVNLTGATAVQFNGKNATFTRISDTTLQVTVPAGATTGKITVGTPNGVATSLTNFTVAPTITSFTPATGLTGVATVVTITGTNFTGATAVRFNGVAARTFTVLSNTAIRATTPTNVTTGKITVVNAAGTATSPGAFTVTPPQAEVAAAPSQAKLSQSSAQAKPATVSLRFTQALDAEAASDATHYTTQINGASVAVESAGYNANTHTVTLALPEGALRAGDAVVVAWNDLVDASGAALQPQTIALSAK